MKETPKTLEALNDMVEVKTAGDFRRIAGQALLALLRKEISSEDAVAAAKLVDSAANSLNAEVKTAMSAITIRDRGGYIGKVAHLGQLIMTTPDDDTPVYDPFPKTQITGVGTPPLKN
jgi:hypothetical protein